MPINYAMGSFDKDGNPVIKYVGFDDKTSAINSITDFKHQCSDNIQESINLIEEADFKIIRLLDLKGNLLFMFAEKTDDYDEQAFINYLNKTYGNPAI